MKQKFKKNDSGFICANCGYSVVSLEYTSRNHCTKCLHSLHVDINPGDRECKCKGVMRPVAAVYTAKKGVVITHECTKCGERKNNKSAEDDDFGMILKVMQNFT